MQYRISAALLSALSLSQLAVAQDRVPLPEITGDAGSSGQGCGGCYVVADVAGIVFGTETVSAVQTNNVIVAPGLNGTVTTTSVVFDDSSFTLTNPGGIVTGAMPTANPAQTSFNVDGTVLTINGVTLTSPTAYNVFTAFSTTRTTFVNGACSVILGTPTSLLTAFTVTIPTGISDAAGFASFQSVAEQSFINAMGIPSCSNGAENFTPTTHVPVTVTGTTDVTSTQTRTFTPAPASVAASTTSTTPTATSFVAVGGPFANSSSVTFITPSSGVSVIVLTPTSQGDVISQVAPSQAAPTIAQANDARRESPMVALLSGAFVMIMGLFA